MVFVDVEADTLLLDPQRVEEAIIPGKTRAIMPVHLYGQPANMTALRVIARRHNLKIIEDAAQAHGSAWETGRTGSLGDAPHLVSNRSRISPAAKAVLSQRTMKAYSSEPTPYTM